MTKGTAIQVFGRYFAGKMTMFMERWYKVYHDFAGNPFKVTGVSPFSIIGTPDPSLQKYTECVRTNNRVKVDVWKNFEGICEKAHCDYFVLDNSSALIGLTQINGQFYSLIGGEETEFTDDFFNNNEAIKRNYINPVNEGLSERLKYQYDMFIDAILRHYDSDHIIMIRSHMPRFRSDNGRVTKTKHSARARVFLETLDDYFAKRVSCPVLNTPLHYFETKEFSGNNSFSGGQEDLRIALERAVIMEIEQSYPQYGVVSNPFFPRIRNDVLQSHAASFLGMERDDALMKALETLTPYWKEKETIADYIADGKGNLDLIASYFKHVDYSADDIVALYFLYVQADHKNEFADIAKTIISNKQSIVYLNTKKLFSRNMELLRGYEYNCIDMSDIEYEESIVVRLDGRHYIVVNHEGIRMVDLVSPKAWDYKRFVDNDYVCELSDLDDALESWETYFERGRRKCTSPFVLRFNSLQEFIQSVYFIEYDSILHNENYVISITGLQLSNMEYQPKVDAGFLFDEKTRIFSITGGLSDQCHNYVSWKGMCEEHAFDCFFNDLAYDFYPVFNGQEVYRMIVGDYSESFFSTLFSQKLRLRLIRAKGGAPFPILYNAKWREVGLGEAYLIANASPIVKQRPQLRVQDAITPCIWANNLTDIEDFVINAMPHKTVFTTTSKVGKYRYSQKSIWEKLLTLPQICDNDSRNAQTAASMLSYSAIAVHIRRGDYVDVKSVTYAAEFDFYKKGIERVWTGKEFEKYRNKHLYVFSDEMDWVKAHHSDLGLAFAQDNITFIDWNNHYNSIYDLSLMSLAKVIIRALGGFALTAAYISKRVEYVIAVSPDSTKIEWKREDPS